MPDGLDGTGIIPPLDRQTDRRCSTLQQTRLDADIILLPDLTDCCCSTCRRWCRRALPAQYNTNPVSRLRLPSPSSRSLPSAPLPAVRAIFIACAPPLKAGPNAHTTTAVSKLGPTQASYCHPVSALPVRPRTCLDDMTENPPGWREPGSTLTALTLTARSRTHLDGTMENLPRWQDRNLRSEKPSNKSTASNTPSFPRRAYLLLRAYLLRMRHLHKHNQVGREGEAQAQQQAEGRARHKWSTAASTWKNSDVAGKNEIPLKRHDTDRACMPTVMKT